jgi:hypothetical protein
MVLIVSPTLPDLLEGTMIKTLFEGAALVVFCGFILTLSLI